MFARQNKARQRRSTSPSRCREYREYREYNDSMKPILYGIKNCDTMKKARAWLMENSIASEFHDYKIAGINGVRLERWCEALGWEKVLNRVGTTFRALPEESRQVSGQDAAIALMLAQPSMIKRPVLEHVGKILVGFKPDIYAKHFGGKHG